MASTGVVRPVLYQFLRLPRLQHVHLAFLVPSFLKNQKSPFSSSTSNAFPRDNNRDRGVSTVRRTGPRQPLSVSKEPLPKPILDPSLRSKVGVDPDHGLWEFFHSKDKPMNTPEEDNEHGRPWSVEELRHKSWEDLHALWWVCCKERNRIATEGYERERVKAGYGTYEQQKRDVTVRRTQRAIKQVLTERYYSWDEARKLARDDPEVDLSGENVAYSPSGVLEEDETEQLADDNATERASEGESGTHRTSPSTVPYESVPPPPEQRLP